MKKLLAILISLCMVSAFAVPVFADANSDYIAAVKAYQAQIAAKEAAYTAAVDAYSKNAKAKADADSAAILKAAKAAQANQVAISSRPDPPRAKSRRRRPMQTVWPSSPRARLPSPRLTRASPR